MTTGILVIDKPSDWTSHDVVAKLRGVFREKRIGHAGTLDPMATGVLPIFLGRGTRVVEFASETTKEYIAGLKLGITTDTQDTTGTILTESSQEVTREAVEQVLHQFRGDIMQIPPMYSAIKIQGKKLYELARKGQEVERPPRPITLYALELLPEQGSDGSYLLRVQCSKGTYVRTICHDIGMALGCGGVMSSLRRTEAAGFHLSQAHSLEEVVSSTSPMDLLLPLDSYFTEEKVTVLPWQEKKLRNGTAFQLEQGQDIPDGRYRIYGENEAFLALCAVNEGAVTTIKSFFEVISS